MHVHYSMCVHFVEGMIHGYVMVCTSLCMHTSTPSMNVRWRAFQISVAGELFSAEAKRRSLAGMLIEGSCRDTETIARVRAPASPTVGVRVLQQSFHEAH